MPGPPFAHKPKRKNKRRSNQAINFVSYAQHTAVTKQLAEAQQTITDLQLKLLNHNTAKYMCAQLGSKIELVIEDCQILYVV